MKLYSIKLKLILIILIIASISSWINIFKNRKTRKTRNYIKKSSCKISKYCNLIAKSFCSQNTFDLFYEIYFKMILQIHFKKFYFRYSVFQKIHFYKKAIKVFYEDLNIEYSKSIIYKFIVEKNNFVKYIYFHYLNKFYNIFENFEDFDIVTNKYISNSNNSDLCKSLFTLFLSISYNINEIFPKMFNNPIKNIVYKGEFMINFLLKTTYISSSHSILTLLNVRHKEFLQHQKRYIYSKSPISFSQYEKDVDEFITTKKSDISKVKLVIFLPIFRSIELKSQSRYENCTGISEFSMSLNHNPKDKAKILIKPKKVLEIIYIDYNKYFVGFVVTCINENIEKTITDENIIPISEKSNINYIHEEEFILSDSN